ncbi:MAG: c-type cytochrome [Bacteroidetes bacterium]|nr:c-type cytochrome [Bacteroidota bacterium]
MKSKCFFQFLLFPVFVFTFAVLFISCSKEQKTAPLTEKKADTLNKTEGSVNSAGKQLFYMKSKENNIACADCHGDGSNSANPLTKYFSDITAADKRTSTYHGKFTGAEVAKNAGGATVCWESYLKMKTPLTEDQIKSLNEYYSSLKSSSSVSEMKYETISLPVKDKAKLKEDQKIVMGLKGDPVKGEADFKNSCAFCHGENSTIKKVPSLFDEFDGNVKSITYNVRFGDGAMPFYKKSVLSDQEIADIAAYILKKNGK